MSIRVYIADDDPLIREALQIILQSDDRFKVIGQGCNGQEALEACLSSQVDVALLDIRMPILNGIEATEKITSQSKTSVLLLSTFNEKNLVQQAMDAGASGYLLKGVSREEIRESVMLAHKGHRIFQQEVFSTLEQNQRASGDLGDLSEREQEIALAVSKGLSNRQISERLFLSEGTVKNYITSILEKLNLKQRTQIAVYCLGGAIEE